MTINGVHETYVEYLKMYDSGWEGWETSLMVAVAVLPWPYAGDTD